ncbi:MAG: MotA/TolQ/ExbB proton channel family protein [bacterium]
MENVFIASMFSGSVWQIIGNSSAFGLFILLVLIIMSLVSWAIIFKKWRQFKAVEDANLRFIKVFRMARTLSEAMGQAKSQSASPVAHVFMAGHSELTELMEFKNEGGGLQQSVKPLDQHDYDILEMTMERSLTEQMGFLRSKIIFLASTGNSAPFMGLLGTVVGIMDSFWSIGERGSASLAVVAPGIAEALLATIVGLGAAIPAVIAYNWANNKMRFINDFSYNFILEFIGRVKKENH